MVKLKNIYMHLASAVCFVSFIIYQLTLDKPINLLCNDSYFSWVAILQYCIIV